MIGHDPSAGYAGYNGLVVLLLLLVGALAIAGLVVYAAVVLFRARSARSTPSARGLAAVLKAAAALTWAVAAGIYTRGMLSVLFLDDQAQALACRAATGSDHVVGFDPSYVPLEFGCRTAEGHTVTSAAIPSYINPAVALAAACALVLTGFAINQRKEKKNT
ncbi:hypothetical protein [Kitasatospora sp. NPDC093558]|uniref:hypothetical protein n=1 Tax=Kitasatospora sp. NPDC093558 TaxID=3155201 RepID=UPI00342D424E